MVELTVTEAAQVLGISTATVKRRLASGELTGRKEPRPQGSRWLVEVDTDHPQVTDSSVEGSSTGTAELTTLVTVLQEELAARRQEVQQLLATHHEEIRELHVLLQNSQTALNAGRRAWWKFW